MIKNYSNQYSIGHTKVFHKNKVIATSLNSNSFENYYVEMNNKSYDVGYIPAGYEHRPDLISFLFYGTPTNDWLICYINNIDDPFNKLNVGDKILLPR